MKESSIVLKQDVRGRVITPMERRLALVAEFERSGLSGAQFAKLAGVQYATFMYWVSQKRGKTTAGQAKRRKPLFVEAMIRGPEVSSTVVVEFGGGARMSLRDARQVPLAAQLLIALQQQPPTAMLSFTGSLKVFVALEPCDMRKGFEGLTGLVAEKLQEDLRSGALFVFCNKRHTRLKVLYFDGSGLWLMTKRLEEGTFSWPKSSDIQGTKMQLAPEALAMLTDGIDLKGARMRPWYQRD